MRRTTEDAEADAEDAGASRELGEIREQGLLMETAARYSSRAAAEMKLRNRLTPPPSREAV